MLAAEIAYLGGLVSLPKFRDAIDAQVHKGTLQEAAEGDDSLVDIMRSLAPDSRLRFETLRGRCLEMRAIARGVGGKHTTSADDLSTPALDRLLWVFLRVCW